MFDSQLPQAASAVPRPVADAAAHSEGKGAFYMVAVLMLLTTITRAARQGGAVA